jgi:hypothetical protein
MNCEIKGVRREQRKDDIWICPTVSFYYGGRALCATLEGKFCSLDELSYKSAEDEDRFAEVLGRRFVRRYRWRSWFASLKQLFSPTKQPKPPKIYL